MRLFNRLTLFLKAAMLINAGTYDITQVTSLTTVAQAHVLNKFKFCYSAGTLWSRWNDSALTGDIDLF